MLLVKYGKKEHLEKLKKGVLRLTPVSKYKNAEEKSKSGMADQREGMARFYVDNLKFTPYIEDTNDEFIKYCKLHAQQKQDGSYCFDKNSLLNINPSGIENYCILSMSHYDTKDEFENKKEIMKNDFPDYTHALIFDTYKVCGLYRFRELSIKIEWGDQIIKLLGRPVKYQDIRDIQFDSTGTNLYEQLFYKDCSFKNQDEYRLVLLDKVETKESIEIEVDFSIIQNGFEIVEL